MSKAPAKWPWEWPLIVWRWLAPGLLAFAIAAAAMVAAAQERVAAPAMHPGAPAVAPASLLRINGPIGPATENGIEPRCGGIDLVKPFTANLR